ncbi:hypothetical protein P389DRAFT_195803 [Cystobasidium minutum MCA 4210]|uniref:uncharacterized protein n=1 Tax=Cystobasidium minutum MCA 4210 TaxID=1397322 RepID=UPI0034CF69F1|eukprot:jgi/Rhomi1/195803/gm1.4017_g
MGKKNKKNMRRRAEDDGRDDNDDIIMDENGVIPNGFTIDFDGFDDHAATSSKSGRRKSNTRKNGMNDDDDEGDSSQQAPRGGYGSQVLPFANHLPDDHTGEPLDGHEYLFLVRREAAAHPNVKTAEAFIRRVEEEIVVVESSTAEASTSGAAAGPAHRPSVEWRTSFLSRFSNMRQVMTTSSSKPSPSDVPSHYLPIPAAQDESSWRTYINGRKGKGRATKEAEESAQAADTADSSMNGHGTVSVEAAEPLGDGIPGEDSSSPLVDGTSETTAIQAEPTATAKSVRTDPRPPIPTLMRALDHYTVISLLEHYEIWLSDRLEDFLNLHTPSTVFLPPSMMRKKKKAPAPSSTASMSEPAVLPVGPAVPAEPVIPTTPLILTPLDSQWLFSLLTVLDPLLSSGEISVLRSLARTCHNIADFTWNEQQRWVAKGAESSSLKQYTESIGGCWMIIAAIWEIWGQRDLWE